MDAATGIIIAKGAMVLFGVAVVLRLVAREYEQEGEAMAGEIARAALDRERQGGAPQPRVTLLPAGDAARPPQAG